MSRAWCVVRLLGTDKDRPDAGQRKIRKNHSSTAVLADGGVRIADRWVDGLCVPENPVSARHTIVWPRNDLALVQVMQSCDHAQLICYA
jgi:hypothetical protein